MATVKSVSHPPSSTPSKASGVSQTPVVHVLGGPSASSTLATANHAAAGQLMTPPRNTHSASKVTPSSNAVVQQVSDARLSTDADRPTSASTTSSLASPTSPHVGNMQSPAQYVFLGGSCDPTTWRHDIAIPKLKKYNISYYNPQLDDWHPDLIAAEARAKEECDVLLFVIDNKTRAIASMLEATEYILRQRGVVLVILDLAPDTIIDGELIGGRQLKDLNRARAFLCDIAARHQKNCDVFDSIESAVNHVIWSHPSMSPNKHTKGKRGSINSPAVTSDSSTAASPLPLYDSTNRPTSAQQNVNAQLNAVR